MLLQAVAAESQARQARIAEEARLAADVQRATAAATAAEAARIAHLQQSSGARQSAILLAVPTRGFGSSTG
jgi:hypothetical protein